MPASADRIRDEIAPVLAQAGVDLESVQVQAAGRRELIRVIVDRDGGVDLDLIASLSREISDVLDSPACADAVGSSYVLEVSSPGVDRPLTETRHWRRAVGRLVEARLVDGSAVTGRLEAADDDAVRIAGREIPMRDLERGLVQVEFTRPGDAADRVESPAERVDEDGEE